MDYRHPLRRHDRRLGLRLHVDRRFGLHEREALENEDPAVIFSTFGPALGILSLTWLVAIGFWLWIGIIDSQPGDNKYGPNPKVE